MSLAVAKSSSPLFGCGGGGCASGGASGASPPTASPSPVALASPHSAAASCHLGAAPAPSPVPPACAVSARGVGGAWPVTVPSQRCLPPLVTPHHSPFSPSYGHRLWQLAQSAAGCGGGGSGDGGGGGDAAGAAVHLADDERDRLVVALQRAWRAAVQEEALLARLARDHDGC
jgi:hypothetical protein